MKTSILLTEPDQAFSEGLRSILVERSYDVEVVSNGKDCQVKAFHGKFSYLVINYEIKNYSIIEVLKYFKSRTSCPKIILSVPSELQAEMNKDLLKKLGVIEVITYPYSETALVSCIDRLSQVSGLAPETSPFNEQVNAVMNASIRYMESLSGLNASNVEYANKLGESIYTIIKRQDNFHQFLKEWTDYESNKATNTFMVVFFSLLICKSLGWDNPRTVQVMAMAGFLHDIGMSKLPREIWDKTPDEADPDFKSYMKHPLYGLEMLQETNLFSEPVLQIVYQHHETNDGLGFPNKLTDKKIYPLAKVVTVADYFTKILLESRTTPVLALHQLVASKDKIKKLDHNILKAFIKCFMKSPQ